MAEEKGNNNRMDMVFRAMWNNAAPLIGDTGGKMLGGLASSIARPILHESDDSHAASDKVGEVVEKGVRVSAAVSANVRDFAVVAKNSRARLGDLLDEVEPFLVEEFGKSSRTKLLRSDNEVIAHKRKQIMGQTKYGVFKATSGLTDKLPEVYKFVDGKREELEALGATGSKADEGMPGSDAAATIDNARDKLESGLEKMATSPLFDEQNRQLVEVAIRSGAPAFQEYFENEGAERYGQTCAFDMIKDLAEQAKSGNGNIGTAYNAATGEHQSLEDYIIEIFKQHQQDIDGAPLNDRFRFMPELREAAGQIAKEMDENLLDPMALVSLVGNRKIVDDHLKVAGKVKVEEELREMWRVIERTEHVDTKEFIAETAFATPEDFKEILKGLPEEDRPFFASLFPSSVLKEMGGLKDDEIEALKTKGSAEFAERMTEAVREISALDSEELQRLGLTEKESGMIRELGDLIKDAGEDAVKDELHGEMRAELTDAVRNARGYWQDKVAGRAPVEKTKDKADDEDRPAREDDEKIDPETREKASFASRVGKGESAASEKER